MDDINIEGSIALVQISSTDDGKPRSLGCDGRGRAGGEAAKRGLDIGTASVALALLLPLFVIVAVLLKLEGGTVCYRHRRIGRHGKSFACLKFRTMVPNAEAALRQVLASDVNALAEWQRDFKLRRDPRVTGIGRFLRKTSIDELPQLINVLRGEMSMVGPRPIVAAEIPRYGNEIQHYFRTRPGITGLWQVSGRNDVDYARRVALDTQYAMERTVLKDICIMLKTVLVVLSRCGAY